MEHDKQDEGFVESFYGCFRDECLNETLFSSLGEARERISAWKEDYNTHRPHSSLGDLTPNEFATQLALEKQAAQGQTSTQGRRELGAQVNCIYYMSAISWGGIVGVLRFFCVTAILIGSISSAYAWRAGEDSEERGALCWASSELAPPHDGGLVISAFDDGELWVELGLYVSPFDFGPADGVLFLFVRVDKTDSGWALRGTHAEADGSSFLSVRNPPVSLLESLKRGKGVELSLSGVEMRVDLTGSGDAISSFQDCVSTAARGRLTSWSS